jgi:hypothetical protein
MLRTFDCSVRGEMPGTFILSQSRQFFHIRGGVPDPGQITQNDPA